MYRRRQDRITLDANDLYRNSSISGLVPKTLALSWSGKKPSCRIVDWACVTDDKVVLASPNEISGVLGAAKIDPAPVLAQMKTATEVMMLAHLITRAPVGASEPQRRVRAFLREKDPYVSLFCNDGRERYFSIFDEGENSVALMAPMVDFARTAQAMKARKRPLICETHEATLSAQVLRLSFCWSDLVADVTEDQYAELSEIFSKAENDLDEHLLRPAQLITKPWLTASEGGRT